MSQTNSFIFVTVSDVHENWLNSTIFRELCNIKFNKYPSSHSQIFVVNFTLGANIGIKQDQGVGILVTTIVIKPDAFWVLIHRGNHYTTGVAFKWQRTGSNIGSSKH
jgi:hypothetical protein